MRRASSPVRRRCRATAACASISGCGTSTAKARCSACNISLQPENWRRIAHLVSDAIYERITGEKGYFDTRIVFISEGGPAKNRRKKLAVMDEDGANPIFLTKGDYLVLTRASTRRRR